MRYTKHIVNQCFATIAATCGIFGLGTVLAWTSPSLPDLVKENGGSFRNTSTEQQSWIGSIATLGALASSPVAGFTVERIGRKGTMTLFSIPFFFGWLVIAYSKSIITMCIGRFITGFCGGIYNLCAPLYISESVSSHIRGMLMNLFQLMLVMGILFTYIVGAYVPWKTLTLISSSIPLIFLLLSPFIPESPLCLITQGQYEKAKIAVEWLHGPEITLQYLNSYSSENSTKKRATIWTLLSPEVLHPLCVTLILMILEQASAFNVVIFYCYDIFSQAGTRLDSYWCSIVVALVQVLATILGTFFVDRLGRRILLISSELVMGVAFVTLGTFFYVKQSHKEYISPALDWLPLASVTVFIVAFSIGIGPLSETVMGEILHPDVKGICSAIATSFIWLSAFVVTKLYQTLVVALGLHWFFWIFSSVSLLGSMIVYLIVPETKGKSLEEIQKDFLVRKGQDRKDSAYPIFHLT